MGEREEKYSMIRETEPWGWRLTSCLYRLFDFSSPIGNCGRVGRCVGGGGNGECVEIRIVCGMGGYGECGGCGVGQWSSWGGGGGGGVINGTYRHCTSSLRLD